MWYLTKADGSFSWYPEDWKGWCVSENTILTSFTKLVLVFCCHICGLFPLWWCSSEKRGPGWPGRRVAKYLNIFSQKFTRQQTIQNLAAFSQTSQTIGTIRQNSSMFDCSQIERGLLGNTTLTWSQTVFDESLIFGTETCFSRHVKTLFAVVMEVVTG